MAEHKQEGVNGHPCSIFRHDMKSYLLTEDETKTLMIIRDPIDIDTYRFATLSTITPNDYLHRAIFLLINQKNPIENVFYKWSFERNKLSPFSIQAQNEDWSHRYVKGGIYTHGYTVCVTPSPAIAGVSAMKWIHKSTTSIEFMLDAIFLRITDMDQRLHKLEEDTKNRMDAIWYAPGLPGYEAAKISASQTMQIMAKKQEGKGLDSDDEQ